MPCSSIHNALGTLTTPYNSSIGYLLYSAALTYLVEQIAPAVLDVGLDRPEVHPLAMRRHVARTVAALGEDGYLGEVTRSGRVDIVGAVYNLDTGEVNLID